MANPSTPNPHNIIFNAPRSSASNSPDWHRSSQYSSQYETYDPYDPQTPYNPDEAEVIALQNIPLLPNRRRDPSGDSLHPPGLTPGAEAKFGSRKGKTKPAYLSLDNAVYDDGRSDFKASKLYLQPSPSVTDDSFLKTPSPSLFPRGLPKPAKRHPFASGFEPPVWRLIILHVALCITAYPVILIFTTIARNKTLFWTRSVVSAGCGFVGFCLGLSLIALGKSYLEAATWATLIHQSRVADAPGIRLKDFAASSQDPTSAWTALRLLWDRLMYPGTARKHRRSYDSRIWSLYIIFFLCIIAIAASLPFALGRIVAIETTLAHQYTNYDEVPVKGDVSDTDIAQATALETAFNDFTLTWTLSPFSTHGGLPPAISFPWGNDTVYFSETTQSQLSSNGSGFGTFDVNTTAPSIEANMPKDVQDLSKPVEPGVLIRYPRWGIRIHCMKDPNRANNIIPRSPGNFTYLFTPRTTVQSLFSSFEMDFPAELAQPLNLSKVLLGNDTTPDGIDFNTIALGAAFYDNGVGHSFKSQGLNNTGEDGKGFVTLEAVLVRLNNSYTPNGNFPRYSNLSVPDVSGAATFIGYDAAICLELYEPWILETYNTTTGAPSSLRIIGPGNEIKDAINGERNKGSLLSGVKRQLNSTALGPVYSVAHDNSVNQMLKDNGRDAFYVPSPTVISFTGGQGPKGYTELSDSYFAQARALADASNVLAYFAGSASVVSRSYPDRTLSDASINPVQMISFLVAVLVLGLVAGLFVPKLPMSVPRRGFELYSWIAAFQGDEVVGERPGGGIEKNMELKDIEERMGDLRFRYVF